MSNHASSRETDDVAVSGPCAGTTPRRGWFVLPALMLALLAALPAGATTHLFSFSAIEDGERYYLELAGREDPGAVELTWPDLGPMTLQGPAHRLEFDRDARHLLLEYGNPGDPARPPSFRILVTGDMGVLEFEGRRIPGRASWEIL